MNIGFDEHLDRQVEARIPRFGLACCYCGEPKGGKYQCCSENHFEEIELEVEDAEDQSVVGGLPEPQTD